MMSSTLLRSLAERLNINAGSGSRGGGSRQADGVGFLFDRTNLLSEKDRREGELWPDEELLFSKAVVNVATFKGDL